MVYTPNNIISNRIFRTENINRYISLDSLYSRTSILYEIRLAIDAMRVPKPPIFIPTIIAS
ncbi:MAG: hypothetical protein E7Z85_05645 [Methanosphaera stadtmanae]|nr:hypothetical protein [Methanosphaera stadtmanae]